MQILINMNHAFIPQKQNYYTSSPSRELVLLKRGRQIMNQIARCAIVALYFAINSNILMAEENIDEELEKARKDYAIAKEKLQELEKKKKGKKTPFSFFQVYKTNHLTGSYAFGNNYKDRLAEEIKFQISFKIPVNNIYENCRIHGLSISDLIPLKFGYTQKSFWQVWDKDHSRPFRESNYNPEFFLDYSELLKLSKSKYLFNTDLVIGIEHESNGRSEELKQSRSWDRTYIRSGYNWKYFNAGFKYWQRVKEKFGADDNPTIQEYLGRAEGYFTIKIYNSARQTYLISTMYRKGRKKKYFDSDEIVPTYKYKINHTVRLELFFPIKDNLHIYIQYFNGYGESLIDYDKRILRGSFGIAITGF